MVGEFELLLVSFLIVAGGCSDVVGCIYFDVKHNFVVKFIL